MGNAIYVDIENLNRVLLSFLESLQKLQLQYV